MPTTTQQTSVIERFLRYVKLDTASDPTSESTPSTAKQLVLLDLLVEELSALGLKDAKRDEFGIVMATLPANTSKRNVPVIGFLAHVDTSPELSGANVKPIVHRNYDGRDIVLPDHPSAVLSPKEDADLAGKRGEDIVTASGDTLLGADDKAGVAVVMAAVEHLVRNPGVPHGTLRIAFTPDEEIGRGVRQFDIARFGARYAYTLDGAGLGTLEAETFSADSMTVTFQGRNTHPGFATGVMVNAVKVAADFINRLPKDTLSPEKTKDKEGFVHPNDITASVDRTKVHFIIRDFETSELAVKEEFLKKLAIDTVKDWPGSSAMFEVKESYRNMRDEIARHPQILELAREAIRESGMTPIETSIRGGTDGSILTEMGLPTPNLFSGQHRFHSRLEWVSSQDMEIAARTIVNLARLWEAKG
ncbi:MAG TPA: peptidase T [Candidatus Saccharimonadales bacterium]|nr:peptidase T [Candidatus Saccharimonadales bacterium]